MKSLIEKRKKWDLFFTNTRLYFGGICSIIKYNGLKGINIDYDK